MQAAGAISLHDQRATQGSGTVLMEQARKICTPEQPATPRRMRGRALEAKGGERSSQPENVSSMPASCDVKLTRFAAGECGEAERAEVKKLLQQRPDLLPLLVAKVRALNRRG